MSCNGGENWLWKMSDCYHCVMQHWWDRGLPVKAAQLFITRPGDVDEVRLWKVRLVSLWNVTLVRQSIACESCTTLYHQAQWCWLGLTVKGLTGLTVLHMIVVKTDCDCERRQRKWIPPVLGFLCVCFCTMLPVSSWSATVYQYDIVYFDSFFFSVFTCLATTQREYFPQHDAVVTDQFHPHAFVLLSVAWQLLHAGVSHCASHP